MATINYTYTDDRPNIVYQITCDCTRNSNSQITYSGTVTWNLRYSNSYIGPGYVLECKVTSSTGGDSGWISFTEYGNKYSGTTKRSFNYSFTATSSSAGAFDRVTFSFRNNSNYDSGYNSFSTYTDFSTPALLWTNCTAPSRVSSTSSSVITPGTLSVNWTEGTSGVDNAIKNYTVYWLVSSTSGQLPTTSWYSGKEVISGLSYSIPIPENYRGQYISVKVQSNATYNSPISNDYISRSVNSLPNRPSVSFTSKTIPSTQASVTITNISPGNLNFGSKSGSVYWARTSDGNREVVSGKEITDNTLGDLEQGSSKYYYFWTYDGLEYSSSPTIVTITKNIKPAIGVAITSSKNSTVKVENSLISNVLETIEFTVTARNKACYYTAKILRGTGTDEKTLYTLESDSYLSNSEEPKKLTYNIRSLGLSEGNFYFHFACNDSIESGDSIIKDNNGVYYYSPSLPTFSNNTTYNQFSESKVPGTNSTDFYQKLRFISSHYDSYLYDNGIFRLDTGSNETISYTVSKSTSSENPSKKIFYDVTITSDLVSGQTYDFFPTLQMAGLTSSALISRRRTPALDPTPSSGSILYIKPFTDGWNKAEDKPATSSKKISISKGSFVGGTLNDSFYKYYNIDKNSKWWKSEILIDISTLPKKDSISGDYYERNFSIAGSTFFNKIPSGVSKTGTLTCALKNTITNRFGQTISKQSSIVTLDFNENPEIINISKTANNTDYLYEDGTLQLEYKYRTYSKNKISYSYLINRNDGNGVVTYGDIGANEDLTPPVFGTGRLLSEIVNIKIGEITSSGPCLFNIRFYDGNSTSYDTKFDISCERIRFVNPTISFEKATYNKEGTNSYSVNCQYFISDYGYDLKQLDDKIFSIDKEILTLNLSKESVTPSTGDAVFHLDKEIIDFEIGRLTLTTTIIYNGHPITKISTSNDLIIYGITPTIAYRQNHLGINTSTLQDDSILTIAPTSGRKIIYLQKYGSTDTFKINLATGALEGFIFNFNIDCGEIK